MKFAGSYTQKFRSILTASAVSGQNLMAISSPGWGKTDMARATARGIAGDQGMIFIELDPSTPPEVIRGAYDPAALLNGELKRIVTGTPFDPNAKIVILDEVWRANDVLFDGLIHATAQKAVDPAKHPVIWGTANFVGKAERTEALRDRFAMWYWMDGELDTSGVIAAHLNNGFSGVDPDWSNGLPDWQTCLDIRAAHPGSHALQAVTEMIETLVEEAGKANFPINPRRVVQWSHLLFCNGMYQTGSDDFNTVPTAASAMLRYAYPASDKATSQKWAEVAVSIADSVGAAIESYRAVALEKFQSIMRIKDIRERQSHIGELSQVLVAATADLERIAKKDPRGAEALAEMTGWFAKAVAVEKI